MNQEDVIRKLSLIHDGRIQLKLGTFVGVNELATFVDPEYGEFEAFPRNVLRSSRHPTHSRKLKSDGRKMLKCEFVVMLREVHGDAVTILDTFRGVNFRYKFLDEQFGEFEALATNVLYKKTRHPKFGRVRFHKTCEERYGVSHFAHLPAYQVKMINKTFKHGHVDHWKTGESCFCSSSYELATVKWFNDRKIDFQWQPKTFKMPNGRSYRPDAYVVDMDLWIDIKGWLTDGSRAKCEWFKTIMSNFELWTRDKLQELGILPSSPVNSKSYVSVS